MIDKIAILLLCKGRAEYTVRVIHSLEANLEFDGETFYYVADAGSDKADLYQILDLIVDYGAVLKYHHDESLTAGQNWNKGIREIYNSGADVYLRMENDFELATKLDVTPYVRVFDGMPQVGAIRLGLLPIMLDIQTYGFEGRIYQHILKHRQYTWSGNPCLVHRRFHDVYGYFAEKKLSPGDTELSLDNQVRRMDGPVVWRPNELGDYGPFKHIGEVQSDY